MNDTQLTTSCNFLNILPNGTYDWQQYQWTPHTNTTYIYYTSSNPISDFTVRKVKNGFICWKGNEEYVFETIEKLTKFMIKELK